MKREIAIRVKNGNIVVDSAVRLKDIASTLDDGNYIVAIENELTARDANYYRKRFWKGVDTVVEYTGNDKQVIEGEVKKEIIGDMIKQEDVQLWINFDQVKENEPFSLTWLTPRGWKQLYDRYKLWAYNTCECYV